MGWFKWRAFRLIGFLCVMSGAYASGLSTDLEQLLNAVHSMRASFKQTVYDNQHKVIQTLYGKMAMQRPGKFRWEVSRPIPQLIIANDKRLWIYDADLEQVTVRSLKNAAEETPVLLLSAASTMLDKDFAVTGGAQGPPEWHWYVLKPRHESAMFDAIQMGFKQGKIQEMRLQDHLGHTTRILFQQAVFNVILPDNLFVFKPKANIDVIDEANP